MLSRPGPATAPGTGLQRHCCRGRAERHRLCPDRRPVHHYLPRDVTDQAPVQARVPAIEMTDVAVGTLRELDITVAEGINWTVNAGEYWVVADRKSTRLNSSHRCISYAVFCLKK